MSNARNIASGAKFVETAGDTMSGALAVNAALPKIQSSYNSSKHLEFGVGGSGGGFAMTTGHFMTVNHQPYADRATDNNLTERFRIDASGRVTTPSQPAFGIKMNVVSGINATSATRIISGTTYFNSSSLQQTGGSNFAVGTGRFTAPVSGFYQFNVTVRFDGHSGNYIYITLVDNGAAISRNLTSLGFTYMTLGMSKAHYLHANDYVEIHINCSGDTSVVLDGDSYFSGYLIG